MLIVKIWNECSSCVLSSAAKTDLLSASSPEAVVNLWCSYFDIYRLVLKILECVALSRHPGREQQHC